MLQKALHFQIHNTRCSMQAAGQGFEENNKIIIHSF